MDDRAERSLRPFFATRRNSAGSWWLAVHFTDGWPFGQIQNRSGGSGRPHGFEDPAWSISASILVVAHSVNSDAMFVDDPQSSHDWFLVHLREHSSKHVSHGGPTLGPQPENDKASIVRRREHLDVRKVEVHRNQDATLDATGFGNLVILFAPKSLVVHGRNVMAKRA
jgi:hypothetical protein